MYVIAQLFHSGISKNVYFNWNQLYSMQTDSPNSINFLYTLDFVQEPPPRVTGTFPLCPISSLSNTHSIWNLSSSARMRNNSQVGARVPSFHHPLVCLEVIVTFRLKHCADIRCYSFSPHSDSVAGIHSLRPIRGLWHITSRGFSWSRLRIWTQVCKSGWK